MRFSGAASISKKVKNKGLFPSSLIKIFSPVEGKRRRDFSFFAGSLSSLRWAGKPFPFLSACLSRRLPPSRTNRTTR